MASASAHQGGGRLAGLLVLVTEDRAESLDALRQVLALEGAEVSTAADGAGALRLLHQQTRPPDVLLVDLNMPGMDGFDLAHRIQQEWDWRRIPIVAVTGKTTMADFRQSLEAGFAAHVTKPIDEEVLVATILRITRGGRATPRSP